MLFFQAVRRRLNVLTDAVFLLPVLVVPTFFSGDFNTNTLIVKEPALHFCICALVLCIVCKAIVDREWLASFYLPPFLPVWIAGYAAYLYASKTFIAQHPGADYEFVRWMFYFMLFLASACMAANPNRLHRYVMCTIWVSLPVSVYGILQTQDWFHPIDREYLVDWEAFAWEISGVRRVTSSLCNPDYFAGYLIAVFPVTVFAAVTDSHRIRSLFFLIALLQVIALLFTYSRGGWIAFFVITVLLASLFIYVNWMRDPVLVPIRIRPLALIGFILLLVLSGTALTVWKWEEVYAVIYRIAHFGSGDSVSARPYFYEGAGKMWLAAPLVGHGIGMFGTVFPQFRSVELTRIEPFQEKYVEQVHNEYLEIAANTGLIGLLFYTGLLLYVMTAVWRTLLVSRRREHLLLLGLVGGIAALLFHNLFTVTLRFAPGAFLLWSFLGVCVGKAVQTFPSKHRTTPTGSVFTRIILVAMLAAVPSLYLHSTRYFIGNHLIRNAIDLQNELHPDMGVGEVRQTLEAALVSLKKGTRLVPQELRGYFFQAMIYSSKVGDFPQAHTLYEKIESLHPAFTSTRRNICVNYLNQAKKLLLQSPYYAPLAEQCYQQAQLWAQKAIESDPLEPEHHFLLGRCLLEQGRFDAARQAYQKAIELIPKMPPNYNRITIEDCNQELALIDQAVRSIQQP